MSLTLENVSRVVEGQTWIDDATLDAQARVLAKNGYGQYLLALLKEQGL